MTSEPYPVPQEQPEDVQSKIWRTASLGDWWNLVLHQTLINCKGGVISNVMVQDPTFLCSPAFSNKQCTSDASDLQHTKKFTVCPTGTNSWCTILEEKIISMTFCREVVPNQQFFQADMLVRDSED